MLNLYESNINLYLQNVMGNKYIISIFKLISDSVICSYIILIYLLYLKKIKLRELCKFSIGMIIITCLKLIIKRPRPYIVNKQVKQYDENVGDYSSCPSGHTFNALYFFFLFTNLTKYDNIVKFVSILIIFSRLLLGVHYTTDLLSSYVIINIFLRYTNNIM